jgi:hypothetical protein
MMKYLLIIAMMFLTTVVSAAQFTVNDITKGDGLLFTPGNNFIRGNCSFNWGGDKTIPIEEFFQGASSYSWDTTIIGTNTRCTNIQVDVAGFKVDIPYVNPERFQNRVSGTSVAFASSAAVGTVFTLKEAQFEPNTTYITVGTRGTPNYFFCELPNNSLTLEWLQMTGIEKQLAKGWILSMSWFGSERRCANISMTFEPSVLKPVAPTPDPVPISCPIGCTPTL